jgi:hypothetical protein
MSGPGEEDKGGSGLAGIGVAVTGLIAALSALTLTGTLGRVQRDDSGALILALILVAGAGGLWTLEALIQKGSRFGRLKPLMKPVAVFAALAGFAVALNAAVGSAGHLARPQINARLSSDERTLTTTVTASDLKSTRRVAIAILLLRAERKYFVYRAFMGPTSDGELNQTIVTPLPDLTPYRQIEVRAYTGKESPVCDEYAAGEGQNTFGSGTACVEITMPPKNPDSESSGSPIIRGGRAG